LPANFAHVETAFHGTGLALRGGFRLDEDEACSLVLVGNFGGGMWPSFAAGQRNEPDPLDSWTRRVVDPIAARFSARAVYPNDRPYQPFQRWAQRAEPVHPSPLGILIHPEHGLWHAYRAALFFADVIEGLPARREAASPCDSCATKPCLSACPVNAFDGAAYNVAACSSHLRTGAPPDCATLGCRARDACPVAPEKRYPPEQVAFHMAAFVKSRGGPWPR
jgi:hypothetical protein